VTITVPSGRRVAFWYVRGKDIDCTGTHVGDVCVISSVWAVDREFRTARSGSTLVPNFKNLLGRYITELPPSTAGPPTEVHVNVLRSSTSLTMGASPSAATMTWPFGKR